jgi:hypothetical protein
MRSCGRWTFVLALAMGLAVATPGHACALTLADLDGGASFVVGALTFSDFDVTLAGDLEIDLADYPVQLLADGFRISGPLSVLLGEEGTLLISYVVEAAGDVIDGASLFSPLVAVGTGSAALVSESLLESGGGPLGTLLALAVDGGGAPVLFDSTGFAPVSSIEVVKVVNLVSGIFASTPHVDQRFTVVPEPLALLMVGGGLVGLGISGRRRIPRGS